jgi:hypothetical protein
MADDSPFPPDKRGTNSRSLANLRPRKPGDPPLNPEGHNGRTRAERVAKILEAPAATGKELEMVRKLGLPDDTPMIDAILHCEILAGLGKSDLARKGLREQFAGRPRQQVDLSSSDRSMSPNRKPTTAEQRQELEQLREELERDMASEEEGGEATAEPKAVP